ncbi:MAG: hypothetical protein Q4D77_00940 [Peptostreptococcaceae bacterium]|nr:hypothetical protein [Peptostreptococcaceae bacterium]
MNKYIEMLGTIKNRNEFINFMEHYISAIEDSSLKDYLGSVVSRVEDMDGSSSNTGKEMPPNINWDLIATLFYVGSIYE